MIECGVLDEWPLLASMTQPTRCALLHHSHATRMYYHSGASYAVFVES